MSIETVKIEGAITSIIWHYKAHFDLQQKIDRLFFHEIWGAKLIGGGGRLGRYFSTLHQGAEINDSPAPRV